MLVSTAPVLAPAGFPRLDDIRMDARVVGFALAVAIVTALAAGLAPAWRGVRTDLSALMHTGQGGWSLHRPLAARRLTDALVIMETVLAVMLLIGAMLIARSFVRLTQVDRGYDADSVLSARIHLPGTAVTERRTQQLLQELLAALRRVPGVVAAGGGNMAPFGESTSLSAFDVPSRDTGKPVVARTLEYSISPGYAEALGLRLRQGRLFTDRDAASATSAVLVNEEFVRLYLSPDRVVGRLFTTGLGSSGKTAEIVGVVGNVLKGGFATEPQPEIYLMVQNGMPLREINLVVRTADRPVALAPVLRRLVRDADRSAAVAEVAPLSQLVSQSVDQPRFATAVLGIFSTLALALASVGLYGVLSYSVSLRRRELAVRAALGADPPDLMRLVVSHAMGITIAGLVIGCGAAAVLTRSLEGLLFGVRPLDVMSFAAAPVILIPVAAAACVLPALRAATTDPAAVLRSE
jgi:predicted permease